ncbi:MAG TPA: WG repeat-containing protein [Saprospiraceae bacterium]|nr:WG repeat-containing protein [Saprospiraceae bacterium]
MKRLITLLTLLLAIGQYACRKSDNNASATTNDTPKLSLIPYRDGDLWGFAKPDGSIVVKPEYQSAYLLEDGYGRLYHEESTKLVSPEGKLLGGDDYVYISTFYHGLAAFRTKGGLSGYLNTKGEVAIAPVYDETYDFQRDFAAVRKGNQTMLIRKDGSLIKSIGNLVPMGPEPFMFSSGLAAKADPDYLLVQQPDNFLAGLADKNGNILIPATYEYLSNPIGSVLIAQMGGKAGLIRTDGSAITPREFDYMYRLDSDRFLAQKKQQFFGVIDAQGKIIVPFEYSSINDGPDGTYVCYRDEKAGLLDSKGKTIIPFEYSVLYMRHGRLIAGKDYFRIGVLTKNNEVLLPMEYDNVEPIAPDRFFVEKDGKRGLMDDKGRTLLPIEYDVMFMGGDSHEYEESAERPQHTILLFKDGRGTLYSNNGKVLSDKNWLYCGYPDRFGLVSVVDANGRDSYIAPNGRIYAKDAPLKKVTVNNVQALYEAIGNDTEITLEDGQYDLGTVSGRSDFAEIYGFEGMDDRSVIIRNVRNLHIKARNAGKAQLVTAHAFVPVLQIEASQNVSLKGLSVGHEVQPGLCEGAVLTVKNTTYLLVEDCDLYGSGTLGLEAYGSSIINLQNTTIRECTRGIVHLENISNFLANGCNFKDNGGDLMVNTLYSSNIVFNQTQFVNNRTYNEFGPYDFFRLESDYERIVLRNCTFTNCTADYVASFDKSLEETNVNRKGLKANKGLWRQKVQ